MSLQIEHNVPSVYVAESRDFQLLCREMDIYLNGSIDRAADMRYQLDINNCNESLLYVIADMQGFNTNTYIPSDILRNILKVFPWCMKRKGTEEAIKVASYAVMATYKYIYNIDVEIIKYDGRFEINVKLSGLDTYIPYIREVLSYLIPTGFQLTIYNVATTRTEADDRVEIEDYVTAISGISGIIMGADKPFEWTPQNLNGQTKAAENAYYSRIGIAKIIRARSTQELLDQTHKAFADETPLINKDTGKPTIVSGNAEINSD